ncbi:YeeE/YedE family protein [Chitinibacteraceae bacterium HSL-7]
MQIDWVSFTPYSALAGGALIGLAAGLFALLLGRVLGVSGIVGGLIDGTGDLSLRLAFIGGLIIVPGVWSVFGALPAIQMQAGWPLLIAGGLIVGFGTRMGSGCTSGHGVCGLSRLSPRSLVATLVFMATGFITVFIVRHLLGG